MCASTIFSFTEEEWKCVLTPGVPYATQGVSRMLGQTSRVLHIKTKKKFM
jgi:hypothetical protein